MNPQSKANRCIRLQSIFRTQGQPWGLRSSGGETWSLNIYLLLLTPVVLAFREWGSGRNIVTCQPAQSPSLWQVPTNYINNCPTILMVRLSEVCPNVCLVKRPNCEGSLQISDSDEKCVAVRWLTPEQHLSAGTAVPPPLLTVQSRQIEPVSRWTAITWWGVAVIGLITSRSRLIRLNVTWLSWPTLHACLQN